MSTLTSSSLVLSGLSEHINRMICLGYSASLGIRADNTNALNEIARNRLNIGCAVDLLGRPEIVISTDDSGLLRNCMARHYGARWGLGLALEDVLIRNPDIPFVRRGNKTIKRRCESFSSTRRVKPQGIHVDAGRISRERAKNSKFFGAVGRACHLIAQDSILTIRQLKVIFIASSLDRLVFGNGDEEFCFWLNTSGDNIENLLDGLLPDNVWEWNVGLHVVVFHSGQQLKNLAGIANILSQASSVNFVRFA